MNRIIKILLVVLLLTGAVSCSKNSSTNVKGDTLALLDAKIRKEPKNPELYYARSKVLLDKGKTREGLMDIQKAIGFNPKQVKYYIRKADILFASNETTLAFSALQDALKIEPKSSEAYLKIAEISLLLKDYDKTMYNINEVLKIDKLNPTAYYLRGWTLKEKGDTIHAVMDYKKAIEYKSNYEQPYEELGLLYALKGDRLAIEYLNSAININPKNTNAMYALALFYQDHNMIQTALDTYQKILMINPRHADALHNVGYINLVKKKDYKDAMDCFTKAIVCDSTFYQAYFNRGITYEKMGQKDKAKADFQKVLALKPDHALAKQHLGKK